MDRIEMLETPFLNQEVASHEPLAWKRRGIRPVEHQGFEARPPEQMLFEQSESCGCAHEALSPSPYDETGADPEVEAATESPDEMAEFADALNHESAIGSMESADDSSDTSSPVQEIDISHQIEERETSGVASPAWEYQTPAAPSGLVLVDHWHVPRSPDSTAPNGFKAGPPSALIVSDVNPGFIDASDALITDTAVDGLQTCLTKVVRSAAPVLLANRSTPAVGDRVRVAIVDLTGSKIGQPDFAGWGSTVPMYGASVPKILGLYGAFQLRSDLRKLADDKGITDGVKLETEARALWRAKKLAQLPDLVWLFDIKKWKSSSGPLDFSTDAVAAFNDIMHNCPAGKVISKVSLPFIGSVTWQSGLYHPQRGGLWLQSSYCNMGSWSSPVRSANSHNVTALSTSTFFTLMAQERLVDDVSSAEIKTYLKRGCVSGALPSSIPVVSSKCGIWNGFIHDCVLADDGTVRYAASVLSRLYSSADVAAYKNLWTSIDALIRKNNQSPKPGC